MNMKSVKNKTAVIFILILSIFIIGGVGLWAKTNYNHIVNYDDNMENVKDEIRDDYINALYEDHELTESKAGEIILNNDLKNKHGDFTESRPEKFITGTIQSYNVNGQSVSLQIKDEDNQLTEKSYDINDVYLVDIDNKDTSKLEISDSQLNLQDGNAVDLNGKKIYIVINEVNENDFDKDDVLIAMN